MRLLVFSSLLLLLFGCELTMAEMRELPEPPTLEVPVVVKATLDEEWVNVSPATGFSIYAGHSTEFNVSSALRDTYALQVSGGDGIKVSSPSPGVYMVSSSTVGQGYLQVAYDSTKTMNYPIMVYPTPDPVAILGNFGNQGKIVRKDLESSVWIKLRTINGLPKDHCEVLSFSMEKISRIGLRDKWQFSGNGREDDLYDKLKDLETDDLLIFDKIRVRCQSDLRGRVLNPMVFSIQ